MNQATNVNIVPSYGQRGDLHFSQYDVGRTATINLYAVNEAYTIPVGATVKIQATKPSGLGFDVACTFSGSVVTVVSTETMTAEPGRFPCELRITKDSDVIGTANFMFVVEPSPHPDGTVDGDAEEVVNEIKALVLQSEGYALGTQDGVPVDVDSPYYHNNSKWWSEHPTGGGLTEEFKQALLDCFENVAWINDDGQDYYDALESALYPPANLVSISAVYTQGGTVYDTDSLDDLKADLVVTALYDDTSTETVTTYTLSGSLTVGTSTITVSYGGKTTTFTVTVTHMAQPLSVTNNLTGCTSSNSSSQVSENDPYSATITASAGYTLTGAEVTITMGGVDITSTAYNSGTISIASVTGALVITIVASDGRTLLYHWDFTGENPLVDKVGSKTATESGTVTYSAQGVAFGTNASCIVLADLSSSYLADKDVDITFGDMVSTASASVHMRVFTFGNNYGFMCRKDDHLWNIYGSLSGSNTWQPTTVAQNDVANTTVKISFNGQTDIDIYQNGNLVLDGASMNNSASSGQVRLGATSNSSTITNIKSLKVYSRGA